MSAPCFYHLALIPFIHRSSQKISCRKTADSGATLYPHYTSRFTVTNISRKNRLRLLVVAVMAVGCIFTASQGFAKSLKHALGDIPLPKEIYNKHIKFSALDMAEALPVSYDARDEGLVTPAKDQGLCGSCWAFASVGALESHLLKAYQVGPEDLSEQQQVSCNTAMWGCSGGSSNAVRYWESKGPVDESYFSYTVSDATPCKEEGASQLGYRVTDWHTVADSDYKNSLSTYGPSYWRYDVYDDFYTYWDNGQPGEIYVNTATNLKGGHAVLLIGWDDSKGAYLCKNSWGETGGPNSDGTFWIAYSGHVNDLGFGMANFSLTSLTCSSDAECDDGIYCNGQETCDTVTESCQTGTPITCADDGLFCNGVEVCNEATQRCGSAGDSCGGNTTCNEGTDQCDSLCGNGICGIGEDCSSCPDDCIGGSSGGTCGSCFKGACDGVCHPNKDGIDCSDCWSSYCCGDGVCEGEENSLNCAVDCPVTVCGDGTCDSDEDHCSCPGDCGGAGNEICDNGIDDDCDGAVDCEDSDCEVAASCQLPQCLAKKESCLSDDECCSGRCNGRCQ